MLREGFEVSLIVGIVLAFLDRTNRRDGFGAVWFGAAAALLLSAAVGVGLWLIGAELEGTAEQVWEGATMIAAAGVLTYMIFWMRRQARSIRKNLEGQIEHALAGGATALALVAFFGVLREGVEASLLLVGTLEGSTSALTAISAAVGLAI